MKLLKKLAVASLIALPLFVSGCWYKPLNITGVEVKPEEAKYGTARCVWILGFGPFGKCTIGKAAENGKITAIQSADTKYLFLGVYMSKVLEVRGK